MRLLCPICNKPILTECTCKGDKFTRYYSRLIDFIKVIKYIYYKKENAFNKIKIQPIPEDKFRIVFLRIERDALDILVKLIIQCIEDNAVLEKLILYDLRGRPLLRRIVNIELSSEDEYEVDWIMGANSLNNNSTNIWTATSTTPVSITYTVRI